MTRPYRYWDETQIQRLRDLASQGFSYSEAAKLMHRSDRSVASISARHRIFWNTGRTIQAPDGSPRAIMHYGENGTPEAFTRHLATRGVEGTAEYYGVARQTIRKMRAVVGLSA